MDRQSKIDDIKRGRAVKIGDVIIIIVLLALSVVIFCSVLLGRKEGGNVEIYVDGELKEVLPLNEDCIYECLTDYGYNIIEVKDGKVRVSESDCPDKICCGYAEMYRNGDTIYCFPHKLKVTISGSDYEGVGD